MIRLKAKKIHGSTARTLVDESGNVVGEVRRATSNAGMWHLYLKDVYWLSDGPGQRGGATGTRCASYSDALLLAGAVVQRFELDWFRHKEPVTWNGGLFRLHGHIDGLRTPEDKYPVRFLSGVTDYVYAFQLEHGHLVP